MEELFRQGGGVMIAILATSLVAWGLLVRKALQVKSLTTGKRQWAETILNHLATGEKQRAIDLCREHHGPVGNTFLQMLSLNAPGRNVMEKYITPFINAQFTHLKKHLPLLAAFASVSTLLGLLGTVIGMIKAFTAMNPQQPHDIGAMAEAISQAMVTTQAGLVVALPLLIGHQMLSARLQRCQDMTMLYVKKMESILYTN
ncbi:MAG: MotA/TolQ/ExbB proton channel family protein [Planctomycetes bacterium]|nr:MotA/TolQ/ExbB proton channel family protein [Planctomycetota bacterium]